MTQEEFNNLTIDDLEQLKFVLDANGDVAIRIIGSSGATSFLTLSDTPASFAGQALKIPRVNAGETALEFSSAGAGDVAGPASATDNAIARFDLATGKVIQNSSASIDDSGNISATNLSGTNTGDETNASVKTKYEANADTNAYTDAEKTKVGHISVTQAVDLDQMESDIAALDQAVVLKGTWDASLGSFPGGGTAQAGFSYIVSTGGTVDGVEFTANDRIVAITDNASTTTYASNWHKLDYTDAVLSVAGRTGAVVLTSSDVGLGNVENTALSTWAGSSNITTLGTITTGTWNGTTIALANGGTGSTTASGARTNLGIDDIAIKQSNLNATVAPTATDDSGSGYAVGSVWIDTTADKAYVCLDSTATSAVWIEITQILGTDLSGLSTVSFLQELDNGSKTASFSIDFSTDQKQKVTLTANTITLTLDTTDIGVGNYVLKIVNGGLATLTWAAETGTVKWPGGTAPTLISSGTDIVSFYFDGTDFYGVSTLNFS